MSDTQANGRKILVVDDEISICEIIASFLNKNGYTVLLAQSAEKAVELIKEHQVELVLSDIKMPGMNGVDLLRWIKEYNNFLPVIMTTGFPTLDTAVEALKLGAYDYLTKPFHLEEIKEKVFRALQTRQLEEDNLLFSKLVALHEVTKVLASTHNPEELNYRFLDYSIKISRSNGGALMLFNEGTKLSIALTSSLPFDRGFWERPFFISASRWSATTCEPLLIDAQKNNVPLGVPSIPPSIQSYIVYPLKTPKKVLGVLNLIRMENCASFSNVDMEIINVLASQASISIENAKLYQNIRDNYLKTISGFALAVEAKDKYTHGHSENVMKYTVILAKHLGLSGMEIEHIKYAGLLHDIGKIGIEEAILNKPGKLTFEEFEQIKKHPELGCRILANVPFFEALVPLIRHHHEFYNGLGYPDGISGDKIPYGARILSVADAFEAMTSDRPYRRAMSYEKAFDILMKERSKQFDPVVAEAFIQVLKVRSN